MSERLFTRSSYCLDGQCVEASEPPGLIFKKSSYSDDVGGACLEAAGYEALVFVRDSKREDSPYIEISPEPFASFIGGVATQETFARIDA